MSECGQASRDATFAFSPPSGRERAWIVLAWTLYTTGVSALGYIVARAALASAVLPPTVKAIHLGTVALCTASLAWWWTRPRGGVIAVELLEHEVLLARSRFTARRSRVPYTAIHSLSRAWPAPWQRFFVGVTGRFPFGFRPGWFAEPAALERIEAALRGRLARSPRYAEQLAGIDRRARIAAMVAAHPPRLTFVLLALTTVIFILQWRSGSLDDFVELWRLGANAWWLMSDGGAYRLFTGIFLHAAWWHFAANMLSLVLLGLQLEGLLGAWRFGLVALGGALGGSIASGLMGSRPTVGFSIAIFAMVGALIVLNLTRRSDLSPPSRVPLGLALMLLALQLALEQLVPRIDRLGHWAGFFSGALLCLLLLPGLDLARARERPSRWLRVCTVGLAAAYLAALGQAGVHAVRSDAASVLRLAAESLEDPRLPPQIITALAWGFYDLPDASRAELDRVRDAAERVVAREPDEPVYLDALALLEYRLANLERAVALERKALHRAPQAHFASQLARFEQARMDARGATAASMSRSGAVLRVERSAGRPRPPSLWVEFDRPHPDGVQLDALLEAEGELVGLLRVRLGAVVRDRVRIEPLSPDLAAALQQASLRVVDVRAGEGRLEPASLRRHYWAMKPEVAALPSWREPDFGRR